jgi:hypothetical protein
LSERLKSDVPVALIQASRANRPAIFCASSFGPSRYSLPVGFPFSSRSRPGRSHLAVGEPCTHTDLSSGLACRGLAGCTAGSDAGSAIPWPAFRDLAGYRASSFFSLFLRERTTKPFRSTGKAFWKQREGHSKQPYATAVATESVPNLGHNPLKASIDQPARSMRSPRACRRASPFRSQSLPEMRRLSLPLSFAARLRTAFVLATS